MGVSTDTTRSAEDIISTPLPGETLATFYARSRQCPSFEAGLFYSTKVYIGKIGEHWTSKVFGTSDNRGKELRRDGFALAEERYGTFHPLPSFCVRCKWKS